MPDLVTVTGIPEVTQRLEQLAGEVPPLLAIALQQEADAILAASQPLVPVDTGLLRSTGEVDDAAIAGALVTVGISYGGNGTAPYAAAVHFNPTARHPVGQAFFLQQPFFEATAGMAERLAAALRLAL